MELILPTAFVEFTLGIGAFAVALVALIFPQLGFSVQVVLWMVFSLVCIFGLRRFSPKRTPYTIADATDGRTLTAIAPGQVGRVIYEGNSWQAKCEDDQMAIAADQPVIILARKGNTLIILPESEINR